MGACGPNTKLIDLGSDDEGCHDPLWSACVRICVFRGGIVSKKPAAFRGTKTAKTMKGGRVTNTYWKTSLESLAPKLLVWSWEGEGTLRIYFDEGFIYRYMKIVSCLL